MISATNPWDIGPAKKPRWALSLFSLLLLLILAPRAGAQTPPTLTSDKQVYRAGQPISVTFATGPGNAKDWIGVYPAGVTPGAQDSTIWNYVDGTQSGVTGLASGTVVFSGGLSVVGDWTAYLLENDGYDVLASVDFKVVAAPIVTTDKPSYAKNEAISVVFANGPGNAKDWIGIYPDGVKPGSADSTIWNYVDGTQSGAAGKTSGTIVFSGGLATEGKWMAYLLENDGYTVLASVQFFVGTPPPPITVATDHTQYRAGDDIAVTFANGPAHPKDWIGIYSAGVVPEPQAFTIWKYADDAAGALGVASDTLVFKAGLPNVGDYAVYLLENDGYGILASNLFQVVEATAPLLRLDKAAYDVREPIVATFANAPGNPRDWIGIYPVGAKPGPVPSTIWFYLDGTQGGVDVLTDGSVTFAGGLNETGDWVAYLFENDGYTILATQYFKVALPTAPPPHNIVLPSPLYFENFDSTAEGGLPAGWTQINYTEISDKDSTDMQDLNSKPYAAWTVVSAGRFKLPFITYGDPKTTTTDYARVFTLNPDYGINGKVVPKLATGKFLFADSGYRNGPSRFPGGRSQVQFVTTPDFDLSGKSQVWVSYHSLYEQNQDSFGGLEYSIDQGSNWLPVVYMLDGADVILDESGGVDAVATLTAEHTDAAYYDDPVTGETKGGFYGAFIGAPITQDLAPYISARVDDNPVESKRIELFRLPKADNQAKVRLRFAQAGTDSWYWGVDDFGLYSIASSELKIAGIQISGDHAVVTWSGAAGVRLQKADSLKNPVWTDVAGTDGASSASVSLTGSTGFFRLAK